MPRQDRGHFKNLFLFNYDILKLLFTRILMIQILKKKNYSYSFYSNMIFLLIAWPF